MCEQFERYKESKCHFPTIINLVDIIIVITADIQADDFIYFIHLQSPLW